ncbi:DUF2691 family protein [Gordoniibacillus kamchatkensis]|uniref:DUF2691 family protein n=1 Tax=Gordoniibacillus kamchatkensis TaxID=1590651 RepID=UPI000698F3E5|nr:DUF2691 family protein [Paenibacillus sp. VKM B-2647]
MFRLKEGFYLESRGIEIILDTDGSTQVLQMLSNCINFRRYNWFIKHLDAYANIIANEPIYLDGIVSGNVLEREINRMDYCIFGKFVAIPAKLNKGNHENIDVSTYEEFVQSNAEIVILNWDVYNFDIYCKSEETIQEIALNAEQSGLKYELIDENDSRTRLNVW